MGKKILLIDDSAMLRRIAASVLGSQTMRHEVLAATRATEGFARACGGGVDLILADRRLLDLHGDDLTRRLLADPRTAHIPVVLMVGRGSQSQPLDSFSANVVETLGKPFAPEQLAAVVSAIINLTGSGASFADLRAQLHDTPKPDPTELPFRANVEETATAWASKSKSPVAPAPEIDPAPPPVTSVMERLVFQSVTSQMSPRGALLQVDNGGLTGALRFRTAGMEPIEILTENGQILVVTTRDGPGYAEGASQVLPPKVSPATLEAAIQEQTCTGIPFFLTLGTRGLLSKAAAEALLHRFGQRWFARLWSVKPSVLSCEFERMDFLPAFALRLDSRREPPDEWLLGTVRHLDGGALAEVARHEGFVGTPCFRPGGQKQLELLPLTVAGRDFARLVNGRLDLPGISKALGISPEAAYLVLYRFRCLEAMGYQPAPAAFRVTPRTSLRRVLPLQR